MTDRIVSEQGRVGERADVIIDELVSTGGMPHDSEGTPTFDEPWQARAFGLAVALNEQGAFEWSEFQERLIAAVEAGDVREMQEHTEQTYYLQWLSVLEDLLEEGDLLADGELDGREAEFADGLRDASEFVVGEHGHSHGHDHDH